MGARNIILIAKNFIFWNYWHEEFIELFHEQSIDHVLPKNMGQFHSINAELLPNPKNLVLNY
jgi:hypothetical protein